MPKKSPAKPKLQGSATAIIKKYLDTNNRPWSVSNIVDGTAAYGVTTTVAKRALEELATNQLVDFKVYGKQTFYLSKQSQYETPSEDEVKSQDSEIARKREELQEAEALAGLRNKMPGATAEGLGEKKKKKEKKKDKRPATLSFEDELDAEPEESPSLKPKKMGKCQVGPPS